MYNFTITALVSNFGLTFNKLHSRWAMLLLVLMLMGVSPQQTLAQSSPLTGSTITFGSDAFADQLVAGVTNPSVTNLDANGSDPGVVNTGLDVSSTTNGTYNIVLIGNPFANSFDEISSDTDDALTFSQSTGTNVSQITFTSNDGTNFAFDSVVLTFEGSVTADITVEGLDDTGTPIAGVTTGTTFNGSAQNTVITINDTDFSTPPNNIDAFRFSFTNGTVTRIGFDDILLQTAVSNTAPNVSNTVADFSVNEDAANSPFSLTNIFSDSEDNDADLTYSVVSNNNSGLVSSNS